MQMENLEQVVRAPRREESRCLPAQQTACTSLPTLVSIETRVDLQEVLQCLHELRRKDWSCIHVRGVFEPTSRNQPYERAKHQDSMSKTQYL